MKHSKASSLVVVILLVVSIAFGASSTTNVHENFLQCLSLNSHTYIPTYTKTNPNYTTIFESNVNNLRPLSASTSLKPFLIITPLQESHVQASVICSRKHGTQIKVRSGGHDYEGLSYISDVPFVIIDMINLRSVNVNAKDSTAWVQSGATVGELYYRIAEKSRTLGFPSAVCTTVGVGGQFSGGGYGSLLRKYGLAGDHVIDARIVDVHGNILNRRAMGEDLFWAIRGGGGGSFGVVLSWKVRLVSVPPTVTLFTITKSLEEGAATELVRKWQEVAPKFPNELFIRVIFALANSTTRKGKKTVQASFNSMFLGDTKKLLLVMQERFPELGLKSKDCTETSWVRSTLYFGNFPAEVSLSNLLNRSKTATTFKAKSDYVRHPISKAGLDGLWKRVLQQEMPFIIFTPYGGRMNEIPESEIPFPHRNGTLYMILYAAFWNGKEIEKSYKYVNWMRNLYQYMAPYVSKYPREAYVNYRDLDLGHSNNGTASYLSGKTWGDKYFKGNYKRLVHVKSKFDPDNFFRHEQSIPSVSTD